MFDLKDIETFIDGLKKMLDILGDADPTQSNGFQAQFAKAISILRLKKIDQIDSQPKFGDHFTPEELKSFLLAQLMHVKNLLGNNEFDNKKKIDLVLKIAKLREQINIL